MSSAQTLLALRKRLDFIRMDAVGPIYMAAELRAKATKRPEDVRRSAKLFRAIDDIETARQALEEVEIELRAMTAGASHVSALRPVAAAPPVQGHRPGLAATPRGRKHDEKDAIHHEYRRQLLKEPKVRQRYGGILVGRAGAACAPPGPSRYEV